MRAMKFRLYDVKGREDLRVLVAALMCANIPVGPGGYFEVWIDRGAVHPDELKGPAWRAYEVDPRSHPMNQPPTVPEDAFPLSAKGIDLAVHSLARSWSESVETTVRPVSSGDGDPPLWGADRSCE